MGAARVLCVAKLGHAVNSSDVADGAKNTGRAELIPQQLRRAAAPVGQTLTSIPAPSRMVSRVLGLL